MVGQVQGRTEEVRVLRVHSAPHLDVLPLAAGLNALELLLAAEQPTKIEFIPVDPFTAGSPNSDANLAQVLETTPRR